MKKILSLAFITILSLSYLSSVQAAVSLFEDDNGPTGNSITGSSLDDNGPTGTAIQPSSGNNQNANLGGDNGRPSSLSIAGIIGWFIGLLNYVVQFIIALALIAFLYGIFRMVFLDASNEAERAKARKFMIWGICALFVMVSVWGLVNVLRTSVFGGGALILPQLK